VDADRVLLIRVDFFSLRLVTRAIMSKFPLPMRTLLPKGEGLVCPETVKHSMPHSVQPFSGPAMISPDISIGREVPRASAVLFSLPSLSRRSSHHQPPVPTFGRKEGPISPEIQLLVPRSGKQLVWTPFNSIDRIVFSTPCHALTAFLALIHQR
jgi:hypothetical protein